MTANCLRNSTLWNKVEDYLTEYSLITDSLMLHKLMQAKFHSLAPAMAMTPLAFNTIFKHSALEKHGFSSLLTRVEFRKWFYALFFRIALPMTIVLHWKSIIHPPLNLTVLFRLIPHLCSVGYPCHWLAEIITNLLSDAIATTVHPPRETPLSIESVLRQYPARKLSTALFVPELRMLTSIFQSTWSFSLPASIALPPLSSIVLYKMTLSHVWPRIREPLSTNLVLVFLETDLIYYSPYAFNLRLLLDPSSDEIEHHLRYPMADSEKRRLQASKMVLWTTFDWNPETKEAEAWMDSRFVEMTKAKGWGYGMWRADTWELVTANMESASEIREVKRWTDSDDQTS